MIQLIDIDGFVYVAYVGYDYNQPKKQIAAYKTDVKTRDLEMNYAPLKDIAVQREHSYYRITRAGARYDQSLTLYTVGENNRFIVEDVPCPKVRPGIETRWSDGKWQKYLKSKGWVTA